MRFLVLPAAGSGLTVARLNWSLVIASLANLVEILEDLLSVAGGPFVGLSGFGVLSVGQLLFGIVLTVDVNDLSLAALT